MTKTERLVGQALEVTQIVNRLLEIRKALTGSPRICNSINDASPYLVEALQRFNEEIGASVLRDAFVASQESDG